MLFNTNLTPYLIEEEVIVLADLEELSAIPTSSKNAESVLLKVSSALETGETKPFYKILKIMKCYGSHAAQQLSTDIISEIPGPCRGKDINLLWHTITTMMLLYVNKSVC